MSGVIIEQLNSSDRIRHTDSCSLIRPSEEIPGEVLISETKLYFVETVSEERAESRGSVVSQAWKAGEVREAYARWFQLQDRGAEVFMDGGVTKFFVFKVSGNAAWANRRAGKATAATVRMSRLIS